MNVHECFIFVVAVGILWEHLKTNNLINASVLFNGALLVGNI